MGVDILRFMVDIFLFLGLTDLVISFFYGLFFGSFITFLIMYFIHKKFQSSYRKKPFACKPQNEFMNFVGFDYVTPKGKKVGFYCQALRKGGLCACDNTPCPNAMP